MNVCIPVQSILVRWFLKCQCSLLPSPVWPLLICLDSGTQQSRFLCNIALTASDLLPSPVTSTTGCCFGFGSVSSFFLELFLRWSPVAHWAPTAWGVNLSVSYLFAFHAVHGVLKARILKSSVCTSSNWRTRTVWHSFLLWPLLHTAKSHRL